MYYPFIRGKQFELLMLREMAEQIARWGFVPIIEPVKENFPALKRALEALVENSCRFILIANPIVGDLRENNITLFDEIFYGQLLEYQNYSMGLSLSATDRLEIPRIFFKQHTMATAIVHCGFSDGKGLSELINEIHPKITDHIFVEHNSTLYRKHFKSKDAKRVLVQDGFICRLNRLYPPQESFSELYLTYEDYGCDGFGDFLIVGSDYREHGGAARAVAIHITFKDPSDENIIKINHYVSDRVDTEGDIAGKFLEALEKLVRDVKSSKSKILKTNAVNEYLRYYDGRHFPGLGYVKKLSMQHHLELMGDLLVKGDR